MNNNIDILTEQEEINKILELEEQELKELKIKLKNLPKEKITRLKVVKPKKEPIPSIRDKVEKKELTKKCKVCLEDKPLNEFVINYSYNTKKGDTQSIKFKNKCLICYKDVSKNYYKENKERVLDMLAKKYEKNIKQKYSVKINFNTLDDLILEFDKLKDQFTKGEIKEVIRKPKKKKSGDGGGQMGSPNTSTSN